MQVAHIFLKSILWDVEIGKSSLELHKLTFYSCFMILALLIKTNIDNTRVSQLTYPTLDKTQTIFGIIIFNKY